MIGGTNSINIDRTGQTIQGNVAQLDPVLVRSYYNTIYSIGGVKNANYVPGQKTYLINLLGKTLTLSLYEVSTSIPNYSLINLINLYTLFLNEIDKLFKTTLSINILSTEQPNIGDTPTGCTITAGGSINPFWDYATTSKPYNLNFARQMFTSYSNLDIPTQDLSDGKQYQNVTFVINGGQPYQIDSPLITLLQLDYRDLLQYAKQNKQSKLALNVIPSMLTTGLFGGGGGTITQAQFNALLATSDLETLNDTYLKKKKFLTCNGGTSLKNRYIGRYAVLEASGNNTLNSGAITITKEVFPVNSSKSTDSSFIVENAQTSYTFKAGVYKVSIRLELSISNSFQIPVFFIQFSTNPTVQGLQTSESNSSINQPVGSLNKASTGDGITFFCERVLSLSTDSLVNITAYTSIGNCILYGNQCQIVVECLADYS